MPDCSGEASGENVGDPQTCTVLIELAVVVSSSVRSRRVPARPRSVVHPRSLISGDSALGFYAYQIARSTQRLSQRLGTDDCAGVLHTVCSPTPDSCCLKDEMKPATNDDLFTASRDGQCRCGLSGKNVLEVTRETLSLEPKVSFYTTAVTVQPINTTASGVRKMICYNFDDIASIPANDHN